MAKIIKYNHCTRVNHGTEEEPKIEEILSPVTMGWNEINEEIAKREAYNGEYTIEEIEDVAKPLTIEERVIALENSIAVNDYETGKWYYRGDKVKFNETVYTCIAPVGVVCVWNPEEYPQYWEVN